jgi:hypothetical protein
MNNYPMQIEAFNDWLESGERGISSETIVLALTGVPILKRNWGSGFPSDPSDFRRCERLLRAVPEARKHLHLLAQRGPIWAMLVDEWDDLVALGDSEVPGIFDSWAHGSAPKLYARMREIQQVAA